MLGLIFPPFLPGLRGIGLIVLRLVAGGAMMLHGWPKFQNAFHWMGAEAPVPPILQAAAAVAEFGGGICWMIGLLTPLASLLIGCTMVVAITTVHMPKGHAFVSKPGEPSFESAAVYLSIAVMLLLVGPGWLSIDELLFARIKQDRPTES